MQSTTDPRPQHGHFTKACAKCRQQKTACRSGSSGGYPCFRCEESGSECVLVEKNRTPAGPTLSDRINRQEDLTNDLKADVDRLRGLVDSIPYLHSQVEALQRNSAALKVSSPYSPSSTARMSDLVRFTSAGSNQNPPNNGELGTRRQDVRKSAIQELEQGHIPTNRLGSGARMMGMPSPPTPVLNGPRKRKRGDDQAEAKIAYSIFAIRCLPTIYFFDPAESGLTAEVIQERSPLLFWASVAVGSRENAELEDTYQTARQKTLDLFRQTLCGPPINRWDLCGAMVYHKWLSPIKPIGHIVDMAYELGIHRTFETITDRSAPSMEDLMQIRLWLTVTIQDYYYSIASGCPPHYNDRSLAAEQANWLISLPRPLPGDYRLAATFEYEELSHSLQDSVTRKFIKPDDWEREVTNRLQAIEAWCQRWTIIADSLADESGTFSMGTSILVNYHLAKLAVNTVSLQGVRVARDVTPIQLKHIYQAVSAARDQCRLCASDFRPPAIQYVPESTIFAFISSAIFLLKVIRLLPSIDQRDTILGEISVVIDILHTLRDRGQGAFLREMFDHLQSRLRSHPVTRVSSPVPGHSGLSNQLTHTDVPFDIWTNSMPQMEMEQSLDPNALWSLINEPDHNVEFDARNYTVDPFDWSIHLNSL